jgi:LmbE family N-acetylglucosaminyl deacetylase
VRSLRRYGALLLLATSKARGQDPTAHVALDRLVNGLTVTPRVLLLGAHPDDDDPELIAWLARGRHIETGYLSLTRGEGRQDALRVGQGVVLGAVRTGELLAARAIDGGRSYFTHAYDFGYARTAAEAFQQWNHDALLREVITIVRSMRPHVLVTMVGDDGSDGGGQHAAAAQIAREAFTAAADTTVCPAWWCGDPWTPHRLHVRGVRGVSGDGVSIQTSARDSLTGQTFAQIGLESRRQQRSSDVAAPGHPVWAPNGMVLLHCVASQGETASECPGLALTFFGGLDTSLARLSVDRPPDIARLLAEFAMAADSAHSALLPGHSRALVGHLARAARLADRLRASAASCRRPAADYPTAGYASADHPHTAVTPDPRPRERTPACNVQALDLDASIDLMRRRAQEALLLAARIRVRATAGRELVAESDSVAVTIAVANGGHDPITVSEVSVLGSMPRRVDATVPADSAIQITHGSRGLGLTRPWWIGPREKHAYPASDAAVDGVIRAIRDSAVPQVPDISIPEELRRTSDARVRLVVAGASVALSVGPVIYEPASPSSGPTLGTDSSAAGRGARAAPRAVGAAPTVALTFDRALEWVRAGPVDRRLRLTLQSYSDSTQRLAMKRALVPAGLRLEASLQRLQLAPQEHREVILHLRGRLPTGRHEFGVVLHAADGRELLDGFKLVETPHLPPVRIYRSSGLYLQAVDLEVPPRLAVALVHADGDGGASALAQFGMLHRSLSPAELARTDLAAFTTIIIGPRAFELAPTLRGETRRLLDFVRAGGTLLVMASHDPAAIPTPFSDRAPVARAAVEHVTQADSRVTPLEPRARVLDWPNRLGADDWKDWVGPRALFLPAQADPRFERVVTMHDPGQRPNRHAILLAPLGAGTFIYSPLTFFEQLTAGVPGSLRLLVNLLSAGCRPSGSGPANC